MDFIKSLEIENFKCFLNQNIDFGKITVLAGANGVGKSSLIQAMLLINQVCLKDKRTNDAQKQNFEVSINEKNSSFLELGTAKEILNSNARDKFVRLIFDKQDLDIIADENAIDLIAFLEYSENSTRFKNLQYLNAERLGPRNVQDVKTNNTSLVGFQGELTGYAIAKKSQKIIPIEKRQEQAKDYESTKKQIEQWIDYIFPDVQIDIELFEKTNQVRIGLRKKGSDTEFLHPNNIGFGISYALPIVASALLADNDSILIIENPEAHLHPSGQSRMGQFLAQMAGAGLQIVVETHSEHIVNGIRVASLKKTIDYQDVKIIFFHSIKNQVAVLETITLNDKADLSEYPEGFFDQAEIDYMEILKLKAAKR